MASAMGQAHFLGVGRASSDRQKGHAVQGYAKLVCGLWPSQPLTVLWEDAWVASSRTSSIEAALWPLVLAELVRPPHWPLA